MGHAANHSAVVLDRHPLWREAVAQLLEGLGVKVIGKTNSDDEVLELLQLHAADLLVIGLLAPNGRPEESGLALLNRVRETHPNVRQVALSECADVQVVEAAFNAGAAVYVVKTAEPEDVASAMRQAFERSVFVASARPAAPNGHVPTNEAAGAELTRREREILRLVAEGHANAQLARMLWVTEQTVKFHLSNIYRKLDVANRTEASRWAQVNGLLEQADSETAVA
jgi:two-component system response regulator DevR